MEKSKELRLDNYLFLGGYNIYVKVSSIFNTHYKCRDERGIDYGESVRTNYQPIELTPEILEAAGFELDFGGTWYRLKYFAVCFIDTGVAIEIKNIMFGNAPKYLHQLQNLYFALCGEELEIQLNSIIK
jgi:hypothetical protein